MTTMALSWFVFCAVLLCIPSSIAGLAVMSVDFGNEYMKIAIVKPGVPMEIVLNKESTRKTPTVITLKDGERFVGDPALNAGIRYPKHSYRYLLDVLGKDFDNPLVALYRKRFPYHEMEKDPDTGTVIFKHEDGALYTPEELIGMILQKAKEYAEAFAEQSLHEVVITVPSYFNQAERRAMLRAADLAGLRVLQLINDNTAVALNYGIFRQKMFNATATNYMFFDIGASGTAATIVAYQIVKTKSPVSGIVDSHPQLTIKGIGFDRTLGGMEFQLRLRDYLADQFNKVKKSKKDVRTDVRAMQKLYKEAGRLKQVLSANADHFAQVESLFEDEDFRVKVTREEFEGLCQDLVDRVDHVVKDSVATAQLTMDDIEEVILMGGGTRIPKVQEAIKKAVGREELGKGINTDEAAALGAVYQAAHLGKGFKVKKFAIKDATLYPISVEFERVKVKEEDGTSSEPSSKTVKRVLFGHMQPYPQKKVMTFNRHSKDFTFDVVYSDLKFLSEEELRDFGKMDLFSVSLTGVEEAHNTHGKDGEPKGIKAHFHMLDSGILVLDKVEAQFDKTVEIPVVEEEESTLTKIGNTISNLFGGGSKAEELKETSGSDEQIPEEAEAEQPTAESQNATEPDAGQQKPVDEKPADEKPEDEKPEDEKTADEKPADEKPVNEASEEKQETADEPKEEEKKTTEEKTDEKQPESSESKEESGKPKDSEETAPKTEEKKPEVKTKTTTIKADLKMEVSLKDVPEPSEEKIKQSKKLIAELKKAEEEKHQLAKVKNEIEAFIFDTQNKLEEREYRRCSTEEERVEISTKMAEAADWLMEQEDNTPRKEYDDKLRQLKSVTRDVFERVYELNERPGAIAALKATVNQTDFFLTMMRNYTGEDLPFTQVEYDVLEKLVNETKEWNKTMTLAQKKTSLTEKPRFTVEDVGGKINALERELKYLVNKMKNYRPKKPKPAKEANATETSGNATKPVKETTKVPKEESKETPPDSDKSESGAETKVDDLDRDILEPVTEDATSRSEGSKKNDADQGHEPDDEL